MADPWPGDDVALRYLLGTLSDTEEEEFERNFLDDQDAQERVSAVEMQLIDDYLAERLDAQTLALFRDRYLRHPVLSSKVEGARLLMAALSAGRPRERSRRSWTPWLAAASLAGIGVTGFLSWNAWRAPLEPMEVGAPGGLASPRPRQEVSLALTPGRSRGAGDLQSISLPPGAVTLRLALSLPSRSQRAHRVVIQTPEGAEVWSGPLAHSTPGIGEARVSSDLVPVGDYVVVLEGRAEAGWEVVGDYAFRIVRKALR